MQRKKNKTSTSHNSPNDPKPSERDIIAFEEIIAENLELRDTIKRQTIELEQKNHELEIEAALEKVRSRSLAMHHSNEMEQVIEVISEQLLQLQFRFHNASFVRYTEQQGLHFWLAAPGQPHPYNIEAPYLDHPIYNRPLAKLKEGIDFHSDVITAEENREWLNHLFKYSVLQNLAEEDKQQLLNAKGFARSLVMMKHIMLVIGNYAGIPYTDEQNAILRRFGNVFEQAYTRFLDLQKAEAQAREAQIEASLERVRARSMAMQKSEELVEASNVLFGELHKLGIEAIRTGVGTVDHIKETVVVWSSQLVENNEIKILGEVPKNAHPFFEGYYTAWQNNEPWYTYTMHGEEIVSYYKKMSALLSYPEKTEFNPTESFNVFFFPEGSLNVITDRTLTEEECQLILRFANAFGQIYRRFLDLKLAEAQAREAEIELALERVRARTMGMQRSDELPQAATLLFQQIQTLGMPAFAAGYCIWDDDKQAITLWMSSEGVLQPPFKAPTTEDELFIQMRKGFEQGKSLYVVEMGGEDLVAHYKYMRTLPVVGQIFDSIVEAGHSLPVFQVMHQAYFSKGFLLFITYEPVPQSHDIFNRFAKVFEQTYTRFLDLQKAEKQAREAKIETALERTRTQSMIMQHSGELDDTLRVFHEQVLLLNIHSAFSFLWLPDVEKDRHIFWAAWGEDKNESTVFNSKAINYPLDRNEPATAQCLVDWKGDEPIVSYHVPPSGVENYFAAWQELIEGVEQLKPEYFSSGLYYVEAFMKYGCFGVMVATDLTEDEKKILGRFAIEFERTYTRFLDLQKAEAQTRESQIEASLERVRSKAMAMHTSDDLSETVKVYFKELKSLGMVLLRCGVAEYGDEPYMANITVTSATELGDSFQILGRVKQIGHPVLEGIYEHWVRQEEFFPVLQGQDLHAYNRVISSKIDLPDLPEDTTQYGYYFYFKEGSFFVWAQEKLSENAVSLFRRFTSVLSLTYRRYLDLVEAEAQTRKAYIETALEKVRARALAMQQPEELVEVAEVMRFEMGALGVEELETSSIYIHDEDIKRTECWYAIKDIREDEKKLVSDHFTLDLNDTRVGKQMLRFYQSDEKQTSIAMTGENRIEWIRYCEEKSAPLHGFYGDVIPDRTYHLYKFSHGAIGAATPGNISDESWDLLKRAASVFSLAYSRFKDLTQSRLDLQRLKSEKARAEDALTELKSAQAQLIQAEKMASLGELTAGIAHEIQNPLNFVNNFSEVNAELIDELRDELAIGNMQLANEISGNIKENEEKIIFHGKRADAIVKGMLMHSRTSSGVKEPTDINALCDEYLRLAYHGLRAKDKSFNATMKTAFDPSIGMINVVPQDIGRVILNLITNGFYAVNEKSRTLSSTPKPPNTSTTSTPLSSRGGLPYEPIVSVTTKRKRSPSGDLGVEITVKDNGPGIPDSIKDKIFQPFFTTKPTGQGTGLGLSLSYDIVKAHGGELKVETNEGAGTTFILILPQ